MLPEIWHTQCAWCGSAMGIHKDCLDAAIKICEAENLPILFCAMCAEGNTVHVYTQEKLGSGWLCSLNRAKPEHSEKVRTALNSSGAAAYIKRRLN